MLIISQRFLGFMHEFILYFRQKCFRSLNIKQSTDTFPHLQAKSIKYKVKNEK